MERTKLVGLRAQDTPPELRSTPERRRELPPDLLRQAARRLQILALIGAALWILGPGLGHLSLALTDPGNPRATQLGPTDWIAAAGVLISLAVYAYARKQESDPQRIIDVALLNMVGVAMCIGLMIHLGLPGVRRLEIQPMITWTGPVILMFAALIPAPPWKMLVAGLIAATMDPLGMIMAQVQGVYQFGPLRNAFLMHYPTYLLVGVAVVISHVVTRLGKQVAKERELGSYRLGESLGRGGMGQVYRAAHRMLARPAAIKLIHPEMLAARDRKSADLAVARFRREAEAAAALRSPHTVELYDFGETEDGTLYFVMELLEGMDLETLVRREGPLPQERVIHILRQVCESLDEAHLAGLVHRDIKPANIHLGRVGRQHDFVKVLDFGLVKSVLPASQEDSMATAAGLTPGTPAYMAPELAMGDKCDGRADLYALGCVAYYLLTGRLVYEAATALQMIARHIQETPLPPSERTELPVAPELDRIILACLAKQPEDRPASALELNRMLAELDVQPWSEEEATRWWRTHQPV
ncbi:MAG TPA: serine/threonine-protein kinase [Gemmatimonadales bacterium]